MDDDELTDEELDIADDVRDDNMLGSPGSQLHKAAMLGVHAAFMKLTAERDQLRGRLDEAERLLGTIYRTRSGECRFCGSKRVYWNGNVEHSNLCAYAVFLAPPNPPEPAIPAGYEEYEPEAFSQCAVCYPSACVHRRPLKKSPEPRRHRFEPCQAPDGSIECNVVGCDQRPGSDVHDRRG